MKQIPSETYPLIPPQEMINFMLKYSLHKQIVQIPGSVTVKKKLDFLKMKEAVNIEIERNDCMRLRFFKKRGKYRQYFLDSFKIDSIPFHEFSTLREQEKYFESVSQTPIKALKGKIPYTIHFFRDHEGRDGVYICVSHLCMDAWAVFRFFSDLFAVYDAITINTPMPKPLGSYKDLINKELEYINDKDRLKSDEEWYTQFLLKDGEPFYCGVHGPALLEKFRRKKKNPELRAPDAFDPIHDRADFERLPVPMDQAEKIMNFCDTNKISYECFIQLGMRLHVSELNYRSDDVTFVTLSARRRTLSEKRCGGTMAEPLPWRVVTPSSMTVLEALDKMRDVQMQLFRHMDYPYLEYRELSRRLFHYSPFTASSTMMFSWLPLESNTMNGWEYDFRSYSLGSYVMPLYTYAMKDAKTGGLKAAYLFRTNMITHEHIKALHYRSFKVLALAAENPNLTLGELMDKMHEF